MKKIEAVLHNGELASFFKWLLDRRYFPEYCGNPRRFLPGVDKEIQRLKNLQAAGCPALASTVESLERARAALSGMGPQYRSHFAVRAGFARRNLEQAERLVAATCVATTLWPERIPNGIVWETVQTGGYGIGERTLEMCVRRFDQKRTALERCADLKWKYQHFKMHSVWPEVVEALRAGWRARDRQRVRRLTTVTKRETRLLEEVCANYEARKNQTIKARRAHRHL